MTQQLADNANLVWDKQERSITWDTGYGTPLKVVTAQTPVSWSYVHIDAEKPNKTAESYHLDPSGMKLSAGWMAFESGYEQTLKQPVPAGKRLLLKVSYDLTSNPTEAGGNIPMIEGAFFVKGDTAIQSAWGSLRGSQEQMYVFSANREGLLTIGWRARARYGDNLTDLEIFSIELLVMDEPDYGGDHVDVVVPYGTGTPAPTPPPVPVPTPSPTPVPLPEPSPLPAPGQAQVEFRFRGTVPEFLQFIQALRGL